MREIILDFPKQFEVGFEAGQKIEFLKRKFENAIICGMGGSALPGSLLQLFARNLNLKFHNFFVHRDYNLPNFANKNSLIFTISYSGNTEETISAFKEAISKNLKVISISSGGKLKELSQKFKTQFIEIPSGLPPRMALGYLFSALFSALIKLKIVPDFKKEILALKEKLKPEKFEKEGQEIAQFLLYKIPLIYSSSSYRELARIWKINFNENSKVPAFFNYFPELNHNEMTGVGEAKKNYRKIFRAIILKEKSDNPRNKKRMKILAEIFKERGIESKILNLKGKNIFEKVFSSILLSYFSSFYLAKLQNIDPVPVKLVEEFKQKMKNG
jgi:glucose/mannose-6-phosphate isomerase